MSMTAKTTPTRDYGVTATEAAAWLGKDRKTVLKYLNKAMLRRVGATTEVSCISLANLIGYKAPPEQIQAEAKAARRAQIMGSLGVK